MVVQLFVRTPGSSEGGLVLPPAYRSSRLLNGTMEVLSTGDDTLPMSIYFSFPLTPLSASSPPPPAQLLP